MVVRFSGSDGAIHRVIIFFVVVVGLLGVAYNILVLRFPWCVCTDIVLYRLREGRNYTGRNNF